MQLEVKQGENFIRQLLVTVPSSDLKNIESKVLRDVAKHVSIPGFRKGKAPMGMIKKSYRDYIQKETLEKAVSDNYAKAIQESNLKIVSRGEIKDLEFKNTDTDLTFTIQVEVEPDVELKKYKGLAVEKEKVSVTDEMIEEALQNIQKSYATTQSVEKAAKDHIVTVDLQELDASGVPIVGRKYEDVKIQIGGGEFGKAFEEQLIGVAENDERVINRTNEATEGGEPTSESYKVMVKSVEEQSLPPVDDELAKTLDEDGVETLEDLKKHLREQMQLRLENRANSALDNRLIDELLKENPFDVPEAMINNYLDYIVDDMKRQYSQVELDEKEIRQHRRVEAIHRIRWHLLKQQIVAVENVSVTEDDAFAKIDTFNYSDDDKKMFKSNEYLLNRLKDDLLEEKVVEILKSNATIKEVEPAETPNFSATVDNPAE